MEGETPVEEAIKDAGHEIAEAIKEAGFDVASAIKEAFGRDQGRDIGFVGEIAMQHQSIASALYSLADAVRKRGEE